MADYRNHPSSYKYWFLTATAVTGIVILSAGSSRAGERTWVDRLFGPGEGVQTGPSGRKDHRAESVERALAAFEKAKEAGAEHASPYEYYMAQEYLLLAQEEFKEGDRVGVHEFAAKSERYSDLAVRNASGGGK